MHLFLYFPWKRKQPSQVECFVLIFYFSFNGVQQYINSKEETFPSGGAERNETFL